MEDGSKQRKSYFSAGLYHAERAGQERSPAQEQCGKRWFHVGLCRVELRLFRNACIENPEDHRRAYPEDHEAAGCGDGRKPDPGSTRDGTGRSAELGSDRGC